MKKILWNFLQVYTVCVWVLAIYIIVSGPNISLANESTGAACTPSHSTERAMNKSYGALLLFEGYQGKNVILRVWGNSESGWWAVTTEQPGSLIQCWRMNGTSHKELN